MKRFIYTLLFLGFLSCDYDKGIGEFKEDLVGGVVQAVYVSPSSQTLYIDSELPTLYAYVAPAGAADTTVTWVSDHPEILSVNAETGELTWGTITNSEVVITAISNSNSEVSGTCTFTIRNSRNNYFYVDCRAQLGLWILDRNIGALDFAPEGTAWTFDPSQKNYGGDYYQWGHNEPAANRATGGDGNGWGTYYEYPTFRLNAGLGGCDINWSSSSEEFMDWSIAENIPGDMDGWRLPTKEELEELAYYINPDNFRDAEGKSNARVLWNKLGLTATSYIYELIANYYYSWMISNDCILWSSDYDPATQMAWCLHVDYSQGIYEVVQRSIKIAAPIRLVRDASDFDGENE